MELLNFSNDGLSIEDHAADTLNRISSRGNRQDFIDMYFLLQRFSLEDIFGFFAQKHPNSSRFRALMSLTYFADAEKFEMPITHVSVFQNPWDKPCCTLVDIEVRRIDIPKQVWAQAV